MIYLALVFTFWDGSQVQGIYLGDYQSTDCHEIIRILNEHTTTSAEYTCEPLESK